uniref:Reverse transcriptase domain-containing protein n=1 Tax=Haemonchus contortus TaxID=6289 RepID=A0A7I4XRB9_HAECO
MAYPKEWVRILSTSPKSRVQTAAGTSAEFPISVGVHQGSALSPLLFVVVMDTITKDLQKPAPWTLLHADDVMLASVDKSELESQWRSMTGVLCDNNIPERLKSKIYRTVIRPVAIYGAECWPATKEVEALLSVMETKMLRWTAG